MTPESTKQLFKAMLDHSELLHGLSDIVEDDGYFYSIEKQSKSITLLKDAELIEEMLSEHFIPGINIDALRDIIDTTQNNASAHVDVNAFKREFKVRCEEYASEKIRLLEGDNTAHPARRLQAVRNLCMRQVNSFRKELNKIESDMSGNMSGLKTFEDKIRRSSSYLSALKDMIENKLSHLVLEKLQNLSSSNETYRVLQSMSRRLEVIREKVILLNKKVEDFNLKVRRQSEQSRLISLTYQQLSCGDLRIDEEDIEDTLLLENPFVSESLAYQFKSNIAIHDLTGEQEGVLLNILDKIDPTIFDEMQEAPEIDELSFYEQMPPLSVSSQQDEYKTLVSNQFKSFSRKTKQADMPVSVMEHWQEESELVSCINANAWLYIIGIKMFDVKKRLSSNRELKIRPIYEKTSKHTQVQILRDLTIEYCEQEEEAFNHAKA